MKKALLPFLIILVGACGSKSKDYSKTIQKQTDSIMHHFLFAGKNPTLQTIKWDATEHDKDTLIQYFNIVGYTTLQTDMPGFRVFSIKDSILRIQSNILGRWQTIPDFRKSPVIWDLDAYPLFNQLSFENSWAEYHGSTGWKEVFTKNVSFYYAEDHFICDTLVYSNWLDGELQIRGRLKIKTRDAELEAEDAELDLKKHQFQLQDMIGSVRSQ